jgi:hypothetical protein
MRVSRSSRNPTLWDEVKSLLVGLVLCTLLAVGALKVFDTPDSPALIGPPLRDLGTYVDVPTPKQEHGMRSKRLVVEIDDNALTRGNAGS